MKIYFDYRKLFITGLLTTEGWLQRDDYKEMNTKDKIFERDGYNSKRGNFRILYACTLELSGFPNLPCDEGFISIYRRRNRTWNMMKSACLKIFEIHNQVLDNWLHSWSLLRWVFFSYVKEELKERREWIPFCHVFIWKLHW